MPQIERANILKKILGWLILQEKGVATKGLRAYVKWEITEGGGTDNSIKKYIVDLDRGGLIEYKHPFWKITNAGKQWLERHSI